MEGENIKERSVKALLCQVKPVVGDKRATLKRIGVSLEKYSRKDELDLICFSEMSFTCYNF